ncbi:FYVE, RhoGEF and PH domain-containing protein 5-like isoform X1 [Carassius auratus]|uniref:FYVE, RhoGEF and PH domain-containing protein 5-like isoform X1 n=2 Tax=Carassius auratus TaxID=7957 RepID=A0A6P6KD92_CARAU|nr:FYVE, RhoGEF and PH domain-containing protein 5-like isoform X1 [Carassius auratus]XP_026069087.1 FYVE, RhoGEF and PH domain-containing protein 5-like isoform X1 [Carassius auratus]
MYFSMLHTNKSLRPPNSREHMTEMRRNIVLEQQGSRERKTEKTKHMEKTMQVEETEPGVIVEQGDELGCGDELAQGIDLDFVEGLEEGETFQTFKAEEESIDLLSDSCSKRDVDDNIETEQIEVEDTGTIAWRLTKNGVSTSHKRSNDVQLASNAVYGCTACTDRFLYDEICINKTFIEAFFPNGTFPGRMFSSEEDIDGMFPDICDAGEALADKDGLSECDLFEQTEPFQITETEESANGDVMMLTLEEGLNGSDLSSTSIEEEDDEIQLEKEQMDDKGNHYLSDDSASQDPSAAIDSPDCPSSKSEGETLLESDLTSFSNSSSSSQPFGSEMVSDDDVADANHNYCSKYVVKHDDAIPSTLNLDAINALSLIQQQPESQGRSLQQNQEEESVGEEQEEGVASDHLSRSEGKELTVDHVYEETEPKIQAKDFLQNRKYLMTRSISVETPRKRVDLMSSPETGNRRLMLHPGSFYTDQCSIGDSRPALTGSLGCLSQGTSKLVNATRVDIPPPFELASITKRPIRKSSPSLTNEVSASCKKPDFGFKRYLLPLRFLRKSDRKSVMDNRSISSRSSSESSPQGSCKRLDFIRHNIGSPDLQSTLDCNPSTSPSSFVFQKNRQKQGLNFTLNNDLASSTISMELGSLFEPHPLSKPRSFSSPNTDSSDYENVENAVSHYENVQIRLLNPVIQSQRNQSSTSDTDGYVDMSSLPGFQGRSQPSEQETDSLYTFCSPNVRQDGTVGVSVGVACTQEKKTKASDKLTVNCSRAFYSAKELLDSEAQHVKTLQLLCESVEADERIMTVWTELPDIYTLHQSIHTLLETRLKEWDQNESIAEIILAKKNEFSIFSSYISHYDEKLNYLEHIQSTLPDAVTLKKQLLQVIVRILQYRMLLTDYLNNLSPDSREFEKTQDALVVVSDIVHHVNDSLKNGADLLRLVHIEHSVLGLTDLLQPGRVFVKEGTLMKVSRKCKQPRHLFLMNDTMLYTYPQQDGKYRLINRLPLAGMEVSKPPIENGQTALKIDVKDISITLSANSCIERDGWFVTLNRTLVNLGPISGDPVDCFGLVDGPEICLGENAPPLLSVSQVTVCMNCHSHFSLTNRRHHCHACGKVVCRDCCRNKSPLKYMKNRRAKVCDHCYSELRKHDAATLTESCSRPLSSVFQNIHPSSLWKSRKGQLSFNQETVSEGVMSGTLQRCRNSKRSWRSLWFLLKDKVLYTYPQPEERVACETLPLMGFSVRSEVEGESSMFQLYNNSTLFYTFRAQDSHVAQRWVNAMEEATVL